MDIDDYVADRYVLGFSDDFLHPDDIVKIYSAFQECPEAKLFLLASTDAICETVLLGGESPPYIIVDLIACEFAFDLFRATSHFSPYSSKLELAAVILKLSILKTLNYDIKPTTLDLVLNYLDTVMTKSDQEDKHEHPNDEFESCRHLNQICSAAFLISHEMTHLERGFLGEISDIVQGLSSSIGRDRETIMSSDTPEDARFLELAEGLLDRSHEEGNISPEEIVCDHAGIETVMKYICDSKYSTEVKRQAVACLSTTIISVWLAEAIGLSVAAMANTCETNCEGRDSGLLGRGHLMARYAMEEWLFRMDDATDEQRFAAYLMHDLDLLISNSTEILNELFGPGKDSKYWPIANALLLLELIEPRRLVENIHQRLR